MAKSDEWISLRAFARRKNVQPNAVQQALKNGRIERRADDKKICWQTQGPKWDEFRDPSKVRDNAEDDFYEEDPEQNSQFQAAKARKEVATARLKELELDEALGELVNVNHVKLGMASFAVDVRDAIMGIPDRVSSELAAEIASKLPSGAIFDGQVIEDLVRRIWTRESKNVLLKVSLVADQR